MDNQSRYIENTSRRIVDILPDLEIMSVGDATHPINFTLNTGDITTRGIITAANIISLGGITQQLNMSGCNVTVVGGLITGQTGSGCAVS